MFCFQLPLDEISVETPLGKNRRAITFFKLKIVSVSNLIHVSYLLFVSGVSKTFTCIKDVIR